MQDLFPFFRAQRAQDLRFMRKALLAQFGSEPVRMRGTIDEQLTGSILSARTKDLVSLSAFWKLYISCDGDLTRLATVPEDKILTPIKGVTFADRKVVTLKSAWQKNKMGFAHLARLPPDRALHELERIPGIGRKTSAAALNMSDAHMRVFVVDTHGLRVLQRYGYIGKRAQALQAYDAVMPVAEGMSAYDLFELHWHLKYLGQQFCTYDKVACKCCPLSARCMRRLESHVRIVSQPAGAKRAV